MRGIHTFCTGLLTLFLAFPCARPGPEETEGPPAGLKEIIVVTKQHYDLGYTDLARNLLAQYREEIMNKALAVLDATQDL
jgi:alpha-mannosidase